MARRIIPRREKSLIFELSEMQPTGECGLLFLSKETVLIAHKFISYYGYWRSRYVIDGEADPMLSLEDNEYLDVQDTIDKALEELNMSLCDDLITAMQGIEAQLTTSNEKLDTLNANLVAIKDAIAAQSAPTDYTEEIDQIEEILDAASVALGALSVLA